MIEGAGQQIRNHRAYHRKRMAFLSGIWLAAGIFLWQALALPPPGRPTPVAASTFPIIVGIIMVVSATGMLTQAAWAARHSSLQHADDATTEAELLTAETAESGPNGEELVASRMRFAVALAATAAYAVLFFPLGYLVATVLYVAGVIIYFWHRPVVSVVIAVGFTIAVAWLFNLLGIGLPPGLLALRF